MTNINTIEDLIRLLDENPEWREALRDRLLTRELIELPEKFAAFVEKMTEFQSNMATFVLEMTAFKDEMVTFRDEMTAFKDEMVTFRDEMTAFKDEMVTFKDEMVAFRDEMVAFRDETNERLERVEVRLDRIDGRLDRIQDDVGTIRGIYARDSAIRDAIQMADDMGLTWVRSLSQEELGRMSNTPQASDLTRDERRSFRRADLVFEALDSRGTSCYVAVEVSFTVNGRDTSRATDHAQILTALTGSPAYPAVAGMRRDDRISDILESGEIFWFELLPLEQDLE